MENGIKKSNRHIVLKLLYSIAAICAPLFATKFDLFYFLLESSASYLNLANNQTFATIALILSAASILLVWLNLSKLALISSLLGIFSIAGGVALCFYNTYTTEKFIFSIDICNGLYYLAATLLIYLIFSIIAAIIIKFKKRVHTDTVDKAPAVPKERKTINLFSKIKSSKAVATVSAFCDKIYNKLPEKAKIVPKKVFFGGISVLLIAAITVSIIALIPKKYEVKLFHYGMAVAEQNGKYGYINKKGSFVIYPQYDYAYAFGDNGLASVEINGLYGYINKKGKFEIPLQFDWAGEFCDGLAPVVSNKKYGYINKKGDFVIYPQYDYAAQFTEYGLAAVRVDKKWGYINKKGQYALGALRFDGAGSFMRGRASVKTNGKYGYIDKTGNFVIPPIYDYATAFHNNNIATVSKYNDDGNWKTYNIDRNGNYLAYEEPTYPNMVTNILDDGYAIIEVDGLYGVINKKGKIIIQPVFDDINYY